MNSYALHQRLGWTQCFRPSRLPRTFLLAGFIVALALPLGAVHHVNTTAGLTLEGPPIALRGYDPVAYFTAGKPVLGDPAIHAQHDGALYQFATESNKRQFEKNPSKYAPQYGGFCAFGVSVGAKFDGDPRVFEVVDGKLYLNLNQEIQKKWKEDVQGNIAKAGNEWERIRNVDAAKLQ